jgi:hypothetical protein
VVGAVVHLQRVEPQQVQALLALHWSLVVLAVLEPHHLFQDHP